MVTVFDIAIVWSIVSFGVLVVSLCASYNIEKVMDSEGFIERDSRMLLTKSQISIILLNVSNLAPVTILWVLYFASKL